MGEVADTLTKKKKKKGRPSLLDLQKRALKQQQLLQQKLDDSKQELRSGFGSPNSEDDDERRDKKHRLLHGLNSHDRLDSSNFISGRCDLDSSDASIRRQKIGGTVQKSDDTRGTASKVTDILQRSLVESVLFTPLPDKKLLFFILDRLQKKDTYGVYSDPVDPEELPDYHESIKNPMDFSTLRKKLESGDYANLEQFEQDVFLICTNAMEYNPADTIYYRQARAILELAKKDFENLRQESDGEEPMSLSQQPRGRPPGTGLKKHPEPSSVDRTSTTSYRIRQAESSIIINHSSENQSGLLIDWDKEFPRSVVKAVNKYGTKNVDENKRDTYNQISTSLQEASSFTTLKQLTPVGIKNEYGYARSLARYAANLGPVALRFANKRIETVLPTGIRFGPEAPLMSGKQKCSNGNKETEPVTRMLNQETDQMLETAFSQQGLLPNRRHECDLNAKIVSPKSSISNHPDLVLQL